MSGDAEDPPGRPRSPASCLCFLDLPFDIIRFDTMTIRRKWVSLSTGRQHTFRVRATEIELRDEGGELVDDGRKCRFGTVENRLQTGCVKLPRSERGDLSFEGHDQHLWAIGAPGNSSEPGTGPADSDVQQGPTEIELRDEDGHLLEERGDTETGFPGRDHEGWTFAG